MTQIVTRVDDQLAEAVDQLVASGAVASRSDAVRIGLQHLVDRHRRDAVGELINAGYRRLPQTAAEVGWADQATIMMIADEPW
jgi:Arc/MetJ-type ribon-helix-helix transcriptional regulator